MHQKIYQDILAQVQMPTRYSGNEINAVKKDPETVDLEFALVFPDLYEIGTSHFGIQILYSIINAQPRFLAERFFAPAPDMEAFLRQKNVPCLSMETRRPLKAFDVIGVSLLYELNFTNILTMLELSGIPFYAEQRDDTFPLLIGGGPCAFNPEPLADIFDAFVIGDGEEAVVEVAQTIADFKQQGDGKKQALLKLLSKIQGVYIPSFFDVSFDENGFQVLAAKKGCPEKIKRAILQSLSSDLFPCEPIVPFGKPVHDRLRLEIARGCSRGCRFCQAGMIYRPVRERSTDDLIDIARKAAQSTGYSDFSLLSLSTGDYSNLAELMTRLLNLGEGHCNAISLPSIRAEKLTPKLMQIIKQVRKTGFTIAPEAGSQKLRDIINKNLTEEAIVSTVENAMNLGWKNVKLYFMTGLPFETQEDLDEICRLSEHLAGFAKGKKNINVSVTSFIPKPHTPFQWHSQLSCEGARECLDYLKQNLRHRKTKLKWQDPEMSRIEGLWSRGDRRLSRLLVAAYQNGARLDGWADHFDYSKWEKAFEQTGIDPNFYTTRKRSEAEPLPWDHIDTGISKAFFKKEFKKAESSALTPDCRTNDCSGCGICDFKTIAPVLHDVSTDDSSLKSSPDADPNDFIKFELFFSKLDDARFFGHLELATIVQRAILRAGLKPKYSQGFNPSMRLSFDNALPVGMESEKEQMTVYLLKGTSPETVEQLLNQTLPEGLKIIGCRIFSKKRPFQENDATYDIRFPEPCLSEAQINTFFEHKTFMVEDRGKNNKPRTTDFRKSVTDMKLSGQDHLTMTLTRYNQRTLRPAEVLTRCFDIDPSLILQTRIRKLQTRTASC